MVFPFGLGLSGEDNQAEQCEDCDHEDEDGNGCKGFGFHVVS